MARANPIADWLENHWLAPAYAGWLLIGVALSFFGAATNTLSGWLYVLSGVIAALLVVGAILPWRSLKGIHIKRYSIDPVSVGEPLHIELVVENQSTQVKTLLQVTDLLPQKLGNPAQNVIETIAAGETFSWVYEQTTERRGIYRWHELQLRTATPVGLFWCRRTRSLKAKAIVYPTVLPLTHCPLIDAIGQEENPQFSSNHRSEMATEGLTRALRPYRWGDPTRLIHWRTSARYGELRVRELEVFTGGQEVVVCLDSGHAWNLEDFEQAVIAAASLYFYALRQNSIVKLWTAGSGLLHIETTLSTNAGRTTWQSSHVALETLAATYAGEETISDPPPDAPLVWLTQNSQSLLNLPHGSRWLLWPTQNSQDSRQLSSDHPLVTALGLVMNPEKPLQAQLQTSLDSTATEG